MTLMTKKQAERIAELLAAHKQVTKWWYETIKDDADSLSPQYPMLSFEIACTNREQSKSRGWEGEMVLPREIVEEMMKEARAYIESQLLALGVDALSI